MNEPVPIQQVEAHEQRVGELAHELQTEALELVLLDQLVEVNVHQLECDAFMVAEVEVVEHVNDVVGVVSVLAAKVVEDTNLLLRLPVESLLIPHQL